MSPSTSGGTDASGASASSPRVQRTERSIHSAISPMFIQQPRRIGKYFLGETLGVGGFSKVKLGIDPRTNIKYAIKVMMAKQSTGELSRKHSRALRRELHAMSSIIHENVIRLYEWDEDGQYPNADGSYSKCVYCVLELATGGELFDILTYTERFDEITCRTYFQQLCTGLAACHDAGIAHRDIKPENLLLDETFTLKIADFGFAKQFRDDLDRDHLMRTVCGTRGYLSPEVLRGERYSEKCDIFAAGIILFTMFAGFPPFQHAIPTDWWWNKLEQGNERMFWMAHERSQKFPADLKLLCVSLVRSNPEDRYGMGEIHGNEWFGGRIWGRDELRHHLKGEMQRAARKRALIAAEVKHKREHDHPGDDVGRGLMKHPAFDSVVGSLGPAEAFESAVEAEEDAPFRGTYHSIVTRVDGEINARAVFCVLICVCKTLDFSTTMGDGKRVLMVRAGVGQDGGTQTFKNMVFSVKLLGIDGPNGRAYRVMFKRFNGGPTEFHTAVDNLLTDVFVCALTDTEFETGGSSRSVRATIPE